MLAEIEIAEKALRRNRSCDRRLPPRLDGPTFVYNYGLKTGRAHLRALGAPEPEMPPYEASRHEPIEEIDIEPDGEQAE